ncbi:MAG TPA: DUF2089 family protein [Planctomycetota bacterium]|jgi:hypothetical protein
MPKWIDQLTDEDLAFLKRFMLASGSLKDLAAGYGISYPTVRLRLDALIEKIKVLDNPEIKSPFERQLRLQLAEGKLDTATFKTLLTAYRQDMEETHAQTRPAADRQPSDAASSGR